MLLVGVLQLVVLFLLSIRKGLEAARHESSDLVSEPCRP